MKDNDELIKLVETLKRREEILVNNESINKYNRCFDKMRKYARCLIADKRQNELLPYLNDNSISIRFDAAILLYNSYSDICKKVLKEISDMSVQNGLSKNLVIISVSAYDNLKYGIPKEFP